MALFSRSQRDRARWRPPTLQGKNAIPLFFAAGPASGTSGSPEVGGLDHLWRDADPVERGVGGLVGRAAVIGGDADEAGVLQAARLRRAVGPEHALGPCAPRRELDLADTSSDAPGQLLGAGAAVSGDPLIGQRCDGQLQFGLVEAGRQSVHEERRAVRVGAVLGEHRGEQRPVVDGWAGPPGLDVPSGIVQGQLVSAAEHAAAELHRRHVAFADRARLMMNRRWPTGRPDWSGCGTTERLNSAAASIEYSLVNHAPMRVWRASVNALPSGTRWAIPT